MERPKRLNRTTARFQEFLWVSMLDRERGRFRVEVWTKDPKREAEKDSTVAMTPVDVF